MTKKVLILILLGVSLVFSIGGGLEVPSQDTKATDYVDKQLPGLDKKTFANLLQVYNSFRMIAKAALEDMKAVSNVAWSAYRQLDAIQQASRTIDAVYNNVQNFKHTNLVNDITFWEKQFQSTDYLFYHQIPTIADRNKQLDISRQNLAALTGSQAAGIRDMSIGLFQGFQKKFFYLNGQISPDKRVSKNTMPMQGRDVVQNATLAAAQGIAGADLRNQQQENQNAQMLSTVTVACQNEQNDKKTEIAQQKVSSTSRDNARNAYVQSIGAHDVQAEAINNAAWMVLSKGVFLDQVVCQKALLVACATEFSDAVRRASYEQSKKK